MHKNSAFSCRKIHIFVHKKHAFSFLEKKIYFIPKKKVFSCQKMVVFDAENGIRCFQATLQHVCIFM